MIDRFLLACIRWRFRRDAQNAFAGKLTLALATRFRERGEEVDEQRATDLVISRIAQQSVALEKFVNLDSAESLPQ